MNRMRKVVLTILAVAVIAAPVAACSRIRPPETPHVTNSPAADASAPRRTDLRLTRGQVSALLLTPGDLPPGYTATPTAAGNAGSLTDLGSGVQQCGGATAATPASSGPATPVAQAMFQHGPAGPFVAESVASTTDRAAREVIAAIAAAPAQCPNFSTRPEGLGTEVTVSLAQMPAPPLGDAAAGVRLTASVTGLFGLHGKVVAIAYRGVSVTVVVMGLAEPGPEVETIAKAALDKVRTAE